jgi:putative restriction endonuclease
MTKGIFVHRTDSIYDDSPAEQYQFPRQYLTRVSACIGDWIIYYEPSKIRDTRGYFAVAKVAHVVPDPTAKDMYLALIEPGTYLDFPNPVPFNGPLGLVERGVLNEHGKISGRAQSAVRPLSIEDFNRIIDLGLAEDDSFLPRIDEVSGNMLREERLPFQFEIQRDRVANLGSRLVRGCAPLVEDQTVEVVGEVGQREFGLRAGDADGADEEPVAVFLMREDMFDPGADR